MARKHSHEEIERALLEVARCNGNTQRAATELEKQGLRIHRRTLGRWITEQHRTRYLEIEAEVLPEIRRRLAARIEDLLEAEIDAERETLERYRASLDELPVRDLSPALRNLAVSKGIAADKAAQTLPDPPPRIARYCAEANRPSSSHAGKEIG